MSQATQVKLERELRIDARPETVFAFLTEPDKFTQWMSRQATLDPRPGGIARLDYNGFDVMEGQFIEVVPHSRVVLSWRFPNSPSGATGTSRVTFSLTRDGAQTILHLVHDEISDEGAMDYGEGWDHFLPRLTAVAAGRDPGEDDWAPRQAELKAAELRDLVNELEELVESCYDAAWNSTNTAEGWTAGVLTQHITAHFGLVDAALAVAAGQRPPPADFTFETLEQLNAERAAENAGVTREQILETIRSDGAKAVQGLRGVPDEDMEKSMPFAFAGGAQVSVAMLVEGPLLANIREHLDSFKKAVSA